MGQYMKESKKNNIIKSKKLWVLIVAIIFIATIILGSTYAFFNYTKTGTANNMGTGYIKLYFDDGGAEISKGNTFPIDAADIDNTLTKTFSLTGHTTYSQGLRYNIYVVYGDNVTNKTRFRDDVISFQFIPPADGDGFTTTINNYSSPSSLTFSNGKALISSGVVNGTTELTTKSNYTIKLWIDSSKINVSSTTKRATNAEGNPSLADATSGTTTATRYMTNDTTDPSTITLYPAITSQQGKIIYTTNEFSNSYYSFKILVEAEENDGT